MKVNLRLHRFSIFTACSTFFLVIAGGMVTSTGSGLAVPDWPLSYGVLMPPMVGGIFYEHGHRMVATFVGFLTVILAVWLWWKEARRWVKWLGAVALFAVIAQGLLGGLTVLMLLPPPVSIAHATLAQTFFSTTVALALFTSPWWVKMEVNGRKGDSRKPLPRLALMTTVAVYLQLIFGAMLRHGIEIALYFHIAGALVAALLSLRVLTQVIGNNYQKKGFSRGSVLLVGLVAFQIALGVATLILKGAGGEIWPPNAKIILATAHVATGALILAMSLILTLGSYKVFVLVGRGEDQSSPPIDRRVTLTGGVGEATEEIRV